ncbi:secretory immunoglobulin A-binding protein EsiB-like isoform X3 [Acropora millepora]|uniref:secretory immunoglobulin A-binding protein EsiB-like isoform X3 n=1 Tax=Acropora millepora TaxID=45264 RepID=UPI001CF1B3C7|nr:secretory immunoglobulin A-binding protein EsiB-like isoform X3 [Acropora millepora]
MATKIAVFSCHRQVFQLPANGRLILALFTSNFLKKRSLERHISCVCRCMQKNKGRMSLYSSFIGKESLTYRVNRFSSSATTKDAPQITIERLSEEIKAKLQKSGDQLFLENHMVLLEALMKHWRGEVLSVSVTRLAEKFGKDAVELSVPLFRYSAMAGDTDGMYSYGKLLETGEGGIEPDAIEAGKIFTELAEQGHPFAQFSLAQLYHNGIGMKKDLKMALGLYEVSAKNGISEANNMIGSMYTSGEAGKIDLTKAVECFTKAAEKGNISALMSLGAFYSRGTGVEKDYEKSFKCYKAAADKGYLTAQYNVGVNYFSGLGVEHDFKKAAYYFDIAARRGHVAAQINLGNMYYWGYGVDKNWEKSRELYKEAAKNNTNAQLLLQELEDELRAINNSDNSN